MGIRKHVMETREPLADQRAGRGARAIELGQPGVIQGEVAEVDGLGAAARRRRGAPASSRSRTWTASMRSPTRTFAS